MSKLYSKEVGNLKSAAKIVDLDGYLFGLHEKIIELEKQLKTKDTQIEQLQKQINENSNKNIITK